MFYEEWLVITAMHVEKMVVRGSKGDGAIGIYDVEEQVGKSGEFATKCMMRARFSGKLPCSSK